MQSKGSARHIEMIGRLETLSKTRSGSLRQQLTGVDNMGINMGETEDHRILEEETWKLGKEGRG
jgi:hypothetical protein